MHRVEGLILTALGIVGIAGAYGHPAGTLQRIGPGFFPLLVGIALLVCGVALIWRAGPGDSNVAPARLLQPAVSVFGSLLAFAILLPALGLAPAAFATVLVASGFWRRSLKFALGLAVAVAVLGTALFVLGLGIRVPALTW
jgi:putative tricarboxylic transport membrane protein